MLAVVLVAAACRAGVASADVPVVSATIYPGAHGSVSTETVTSATLRGCPLYSGGNPIFLNPPGISQPLPPASTWSLETVISCGLRIPITGVTRVQVVRTNGIMEVPLTNADVADPSSFHDPQAQDVLPVITVNGGSDEYAYYRPTRGDHDRNAGDEVTAVGQPIKAFVWVNSQPLVVTATQHQIPGSQAVRLSASVQTADGAAVPVNQLTWQWSFYDDGTTSRQASPRHTPAAAAYNVTVEVSDQSQGTAGTATLLVTTPTKPAAGNHRQTGGHKPTSSKSPTGKDNGGSNERPGGSSSAGQSSPATPSQQPKSQTQPSSPTPNPSSSPPSPPATSTPATTPTAPPPTTTSESTPTPAPLRPKRTKPERVPPTATGPVVKGRLIADVTPLPESSSPLVRATASASVAPTVRQATSTTTSPLAAIAAGAAVAALLGLGACYELRGRRRSHAMRIGT